MFRRGRLTTVGGEATSFHAVDSSSGAATVQIYCVPTLGYANTGADAVPDAYKRYLTNSLRDVFELPGTPIRLMLREKDNPFKGRAKRKH